MDSKRIIFGGGGSSLIVHQGYIDLDKHFWKNILPRVFLDELKISKNIIEEAFSFIFSLFFFWGGFAVQNLREKSLHDRGQGSLEKGVIGH
jgi:hypothetical protein